MGNGNQGYGLSRSLKGGSGVKSRWSGRRISTAIAFLDLPLQSDRLSPSSNDGA